MPTVSLSSSKRSSRKGRAVAKRKAGTKGPSFGEWTRRVAGSAKSGRKNRPTIEGLGDFNRLTQGVLKSGKSVVVRTSKGLVRIAPHDPNEAVALAPRGALRLTAEEIRLHNTFGDSL